MCACCCSVAQSCSTLCNPMDCSMPGLPVHHYLPQLTQTHVHRVSDAIQPSHPLSSPSPPAFNLSQQQGLFTWVSSSHQVTRVLELQLQLSVLPMNIQDWFPRTFSRTSRKWGKESLCSGLRQLPTLLNFCRLYLHFSEALRAGSCKMHCKQ